MCATIYDSKKFTRVTKVSKMYILLLLLLLLLLFLCGSPAMLKDHFHSPCHAVWTDERMNWDCLSTKKLNLYQKAMTDCHKTWYVGSARHKCYPRVCHHQVHISNSHFSDWPITTMANIQNSMWATVTNFGSSALKYYPCVLLLICILSTLFAYLFWLANNNKSYTQSANPHNLRTACRFLSRVL